MNEKDFFERFTRILENTKTQYGLESVHDALIVWFGENFLFLDPEDVKERVVTDSHAEGVDAILLDQDSTTFLFVQSQTIENVDKAKDNFSETDLKSTLTGVQFLLKGSYKGKITPELENLVDEYHDLVEKGGYKTKVVFLILKEKPVDDKFAKNFEKDFHADVEFVNFKSFHEFYEKVYLMRLASPPEKISFRVITNYLKKETPHKSVVFTCKANELAKIYNDNKEEIFQQNVRYFLGMRARSINRQILATATSDTQKNDFWYFNNGITLVCKKIEEIPSGKVVNLTSAQIINGAQTTYALYEAYKNGKLDDNVEVLVKAIETDNRPFVENVTLYTNSQNAIRLRDLCSNDEVQIATQKTLADCYTYFYERKRGEFESTYKTEEDRTKHLGKGYRLKIISNENAAQAFLALYLDMPSQAKAEKARIFMKDAPGFYDTIFKKTDVFLPEKILLSWKLLKYIEAKKKEYKRVYRTAENVSAKTRREIYRSDFVLHSDYFLLNILGDFLEHEGLEIRSKKEDVLTTISMIDKKDAKIEMNLKQIIDAMAEYFDVLKRETGYYHNKFFKNEKGIGLMRNHLKEKKFDFVRLM